MVFFVAIYGLYFAYSHPSFRIQQIVIENSQFTDPYEMDLFFKSYLNKNGYGVVYDRALKERVLDAFPTIINFNIRFRDDQSLVVRLNEKPPWVMTMDRGHMILIAKDGTLLTHQTEYLDITNYNRLQVVKGIPSEWLTQYSLHKDVVGIIQHVKSGLDVQFSQLSFQIQLGDLQSHRKASIHRGNITLIQDDQLPIFLGSIHGLEQKLYHLSLFYERVDMDRVDIEYIDLRVDGKVYVKYGAS